VCVCVCVCVCVFECMRCKWANCTYGRSDLSAHTHSLYSLAIALCPAFANSLCPHAVFFKASAQIDFDLSVTESSTSTVTKSQSYTSGVSQPVSPHSTLCCSTFEKLETFQGTHFWEDWVAKGWVQSSWILLVLTGIHTRLRASRKV
jgi:hypothetical protein